MGPCRKRKHPDVTPSVRDVIVPFRERIPANTSRFSIQIPHLLAPKRLFHFNRLFLAPNLFNIEAQELKVEAKVEDQMAVRSFVVNLTAQFPNPKALFIHPYNNKLQATDLFINGVNSYFDSQKPDFAMQCPFFFDWVDLNNSLHDYDTWAKLVGMVFYGELYDKAKHFGVLPQSVAGMEGVNDLKIPINTMSAVEAMARLRYRLWVAPYTKITFSSDAPLLDLGFTPEQFGSRTVLKQIEIINPTFRYRVWNVGVNMPSKVFSKWDFKMTVSPATTPINSNRYTVNMTPEKFNNSAKLAKVMIDVVKRLAADINVYLSLDYDPATSKFIFTFPTSDLVTLSLNLTDELCARLGYSGVIAITKGLTPQPEPTAATTTGSAPPGKPVADVKKKVVAICYDTGLVICSLEQTSANTTSGIYDYYMASLFPHLSGTMQMAALNSSSLPPSTPVPLTSGASTSVPLHFNLSRIYDNQQVADFAWKHDAFIYGELRGTALQL